MTSSCRREGRFEATGERLILGGPPRLGPCANATFPTMVLAHDVHYGLREYLSFEASSNVKHEYLGGQLYAMAGGTPEHAALAAAFLGLLFAQLRAGRCRPYDADLRVRVREADLLTYPDVTVISGPVDVRELYEAAAEPRT